MIRKLSALSMILCFTACAARQKPAAEPSMAPAPSGGAGGEAAPATAAPSSAMPTSTEGAVEEPKAPPPPPTVPEPTGGAAAGTKAPATKAPTTAPAPPTSTKPTAPGVDAGGGGGSKANTIGAAQASFDDARKTFIAAADCVHMCKALTSMSNATTHLCELTQGSSEQKRCTDAKSKLAAADAKVKSSCGGCD